MNNDDEFILKVIQSMIRGSRNIVTYEYLEYNCHTNLKDEDMIKMHIDFALENGDKDRFMELTGQLKEMAI